MPNDQPSVVISDLTKTYYPSPAWMRFMVRTQIRRPVRALNGIDLAVSPGQILAVVGPNGAGKTTAFRILIGLTTPSSGKATIHGLDCHTQSTRVRRLIGWMPAEDRSLLLRLSCAENLHFHGRLQGMRGNELRERIREALNMVGLGDRADNSVFALSAGMRARLQLARALLHRPRVLILDEPTSAIDPVAAHELLELIIGIVEEEQLATLISSHRLEEIEALHTNVVLLDRGRIRYNGDLDELRDDWDRTRVEVRFRSEDAAAHSAVLFKQAEIGDVLEADGTSMACALNRSVTTGDMLNVLAPTLPELDHVRELKMPLRDVLAQMYKQAGYEPEEEPPHRGRHRGRRR